MQVNLNVPQYERVVVCPICQIVNNSGARLRGRTCRKCPCTLSAFFLPVRHDEDGILSFGFLKQKIYLLVYEDAFQERKQHVSRIVRSRTDQYFSHPHIPSNRFRGGLRQTFSQNSLKHRTIPCNWQCFLSCCGFHIKLSSGADRHILLSQLFSSLVQYR